MRKLLLITSFLLALVTTTFAETKAKTHFPDTAGLMTSEEVLAKFPSKAPTVLEYVQDDTAAPNRVEKITLVDGGGVAYHYSLSGHQYQLTHIDFTTVYNVFNTGQDVYISLSTGLNLDSYALVIGPSARWSFVSDSGAYFDITGTALFGQDKPDISVTFGFGVRAKF